METFKFFILIFILTGGALILIPQSEANLKKAQSRSLLTFQDSLRESDCFPSTGYHRLGTTRFFVTEAKITAENLNTACGEPGLKFGSIDSLTDNEQVTQYLLQSGNDAMEGIWIDVVGRRDIPRFTNRDNCPLLFSRFYEGEPNAHDQDSCVYIVGSRGGWPHFSRPKTALWDDNPCANTPDQKRRVLCECRKTPSANCGKSPTDLDQGLRQLENTMLFHSIQQRNWSSAIETCESSGMLPGFVENTEELEGVRMSLARSDVAYWFLWLGATVEGGIATWLNPNVTFPIEPLDFGAGIKTKSCLNMGVGNMDKLIKQASDCSIPLHFLCKRPPPGHEIKKCKSRESFSPVVQRIWSLPNSQLTFDGALSCCHSQNWSLISVHEISDKKDVLRSTLQNNGVFWASTGDDSTCATVHYGTTLQIEFPSNCHNVTRWVLCSEPMGDKGNSSSSPPFPFTSLVIINNNQIEHQNQDSQLLTKPTGNVAGISSDWKDFVAIFFPILFLLLPAFWLVPAVGAIIGTLLLAIALEDIIGILEIF